jgi:hypothetical protein
VVKSSVDSVCEFATSKGSFNEAEGSDTTQVPSRVGRHDYNASIGCEWRRREKAVHHYTGNGAGHCASLKATCVWWNDIWRVEIRENSFRHKKSNILWSLCLWVVINDGDPEMRRVCLRGRCDISHGFAGHWQDVWKIFQLRLW